MFLKCRINCTRTRTEITIAFHVGRDANFYLIKVLTPVFMLTMLSLHVYMFDPSNISDRVATTATYFLAAFAMLYVVSESLPKTSFLTRVDKTIFLSTCNLLIAGFTTTLLYFFLKQNGAIEVPETSEMQARKHSGGGAEELKQAHLTTNIAAAREQAHIINIAVAFFCFGARRLTFASS